MQQSRTLLAVVVSMAIIFVYYTWISPPPNPQQQPQVQQQVPTTSQISPTGQTGPTTPTEAVPAQAVLKTSEPVSDKDLVWLENDKVKIGFLKSSGVVVRWIVKDFRETIEKDSKLKDLLFSDFGQGAASLILEGQQPKFDVRSSAGNILEFSSSEPYGIVQKFELVPDQPYLVNVTLEISNTSSVPLLVKPKVMIDVPQKKQENLKTGFLSFLNPPPDLILPLVYYDNKVTYETNPAKIPELKSYAGNVFWLGLTDRYFLLSVIARQQSGVLATYGKFGPDRLYNSLAYGDFTLAAGEKIEKKYSIYFGPKTRTELVKPGVQLEKSVDYGWFGWIATPILWLLIFFEKYLGNWGVAIIVLTFFIKILLHPINKKAMDSMKAMQKIQPELKELRDKFASDKQKLNMEMMGLFKRHKVNPMGGCLPLLLQFPIYIALYKVLNNAIELYHAPFFWFYKDLSVADPYMITPILLGVLMVLQQKFTPSPSVDPMQKKMMMIMPLMFIVFMIQLPSGLVIYILVNTLMSVVQQYMMTKGVSGMDLLKKVTGGGAG